MRFTGTFNLAVASALMYHVEKRKLIDVFPQSVREVWDDWELRILIVLSLIFQILLIVLGNRRKYISRTRIRIALWFGYLMADWVATVALGVISNNTQFDCKKEKKAQAELMSFWAPFLLLHLGGPDTITAYSLEDNELWLRHLLGLVIQTGLALYILLEAWPGSSHLPLVSLFLLCVGLIKYCERTWALRAANSEHFRDSLLTPPDPGPNYARFMQEFTLRRAQGFHVKADEVIEIQVPTEHFYPDNQGKLISEAYDLFQTFKRLFVDLILSFQDRERSQPYFQKLTSEDAFHVVEVELGFAYDILYSKASVSYTLLGFILRLLTFLCTCAVLVVFCFLVENQKEYDMSDLIITYLLLVAAVLLELYAIIIMLSSDWMDHWLTKHNKTRDSLIISCLRQPNKIWWSNSMAQYNLLSVCLKDKPAMFYGIQKLFGINEYREKHRYKTYNKVSEELKDVIFTQLKKFVTRSIPDGKNNLCTNCTRSFALLEHDYPSLGLDNWSTPKVEFDQKIILWHIATDLCYYLDFVENRGNISSNCQESKHLSDYMLYLLVMYPFMLPMGIGMIRIRDTLAEAMNFFQEKSWKTERVDQKAEACKKLLQVNTQVLPAKVKGDRSKSVLFDACRLAKLLHGMEKEQKWVIVSDAWVGMVAFAATQCRGNHHAQQLRKGGELLTHVWLLMAHLGITDQFQIDQGHARPKLNIK